MSDNPPSEPTAFPIPYTARDITPESVDCYSSPRTIGVFKNGEQVGEFQRNYPSFGVETFAPFQRDGQWYALYSRSYVAISVMRLPSCEHIGGESETDGFGFCPVAIYIPRYQLHYEKGVPESELHKYPEQNHHWIRLDSEEREYDPSCWEADHLVHFERFAFVAGCIWGDDLSWKIEGRDLEQSHEGIITKLDWGYLELAPTLTLREAVHLSGWDRRGQDTSFSTNVTFSIRKTIRLSQEAGKPIEIEQFEN